MESENLELSSELIEVAIKEETDEYNDNVDIKTETTDDSTQDDNPFKDIHLEVKQEIISLSLEKESTDSQSDDSSVVKSEIFIDNVDLDIKADTQLDTDIKMSKANVKSEMLMDETFVSYDFPDFEEDSQSMDSDDMAALNQGDTCLHKKVRIKSEDYTSEEKTIIARVYHYFQDEYNMMKAKNENSDLSPLANVRKRTAEATGVPERIITIILREEKELPSTSSKPVPPVRKRRRRNKKYDLKK